MMLVWKTCLIGAFICLSTELTKTFTDGKSLRKHAYIILIPCKPHFYTVKPGFTGVCIIFLISAQKHRLWILVRTASPRCFEQKYEKYQSFLPENFWFFEVKFSIYLNKRFSQW